MLLVLAEDLAGTHLTTYQGYMLLNEALAGKLSIYQAKYIASISYLAGRGA